MSKSPSLRRIQADIRELALDPSDRYHAAPMENDMFEWHFTIRGADGTDFEGGVYHGRILLPPDYPYKPPHIIFLTPTGRFESNTKVCLSFSAYHPELWQPAWGIRLILEALISFLPTPADGAIGALDWSPSERRKLATKSTSFQCPCCGPVVNLLPKLKSGTSATNSKPNRFQKEIEHLQLLQQQEHQKEEADEKDAETLLDQGGERPASANDAEQDAEQMEEVTSLEESKEPPQATPQPQKGDTEATDEAECASSPVIGLEPSPKANAAPTEQPPAPSPIYALPPVEPTEEALDPLAVEAPPEPHAVARMSQDDSALWDPFLQAAIVLLSVICYLLWRKVKALWEDLQTLEN